MTGIHQFYKIGTLTLLLACAQIHVTARTIKELFTEMPNEMLPLLSQNDRLDFVDYKENNMRARVTNTFGGKSEMTAVTDDYFHITLSNSSEISAKMLYTEGGDTIICVVNTYNTPIKDSDLRFYDTTWKPLETDKYISTPTYEDYWEAADTLSDDEYAGLLHKVDMHTTEILLSPESTDITYQIHIQTLEKKDEERITPLIKKQTLQWNGKHFSL
jgi:hypothetical protein